MLLETLQQHLIQSLKNRETEKVDTIRYLLADLKNQKIEKKRELTDDEVLSAIQKQVKTHTDSIEAFKKGNRDDLVAKEQQQLDILKSYLPEQLGEDEITEIAEKAIQETHATSRKEMGSVMAKISAELGGRADKSKVAQIVARLLEQHA